MTAVDTSKTTVNPSEFNEYMKQRCGEYAPAVAVLNMQRDILQRLVNGGQISNAGAAELTKCHFGVFQICMQMLGKNAGDVQKVLKMAGEVAETLRKLDAILTLGNESKPPVDESQIIAPPPLEK